MKYKGLPISMKNKYLILLFVFFFVSVVFVRFYNISNTARFTRDESDVLRQIYNIFIKRDITFVGPTDVTNTIVYPSTSLYLTLPFAILGGFTPQSPAYAAAFFGSLTVLVIILIAKKVNDKYIFLISLLSIIWFPLIEASRWAWNPHLIPLFSFLAVFFLLQDRRECLIISGILFGLTFHLHYLAFVAFSSFFVLFGFYKFKRREFKKPLFLAIGFALMLIPFILFDIKNPPGLFFGKYLQSNMVKAGFSNEINIFLPTFGKNLIEVLVYLTQSRMLAYLLGIVAIRVLLFDFKEKAKNLIYFVPLLPQVAIISFLPSFENRYFIPALSFFIVWLILKRDRKTEMFTKFAICIMIIGSLLTIIKQLSVPIREPAAGVVNGVSVFIAESVIQNDRKNVNVAVLASPDPDPLGVIYRHTLQVKGVSLLLENQYEITDNLYVITTSDEEIVRNDPANVINNFRQGPLAETFELKDTEWRVYLLNKY